MRAPAVVLMVVHHSSLDPIPNITPIHHTRVNLADLLACAPPIGTKHLAHDVIPLRTFRGKEVVQLLVEAKACCVFACHVRSDPVLKETVFGSSRPTTGLRLGPVPNSGKGVRVRSVMPGSLAEQAGLRAEDIVLAVDGERFDDLSGARAVQTMTRAIGRADAGGSVRIEYLRAGEVNVTDTRTQTSAEIAQLRGAMVTQRGDGPSPGKPRAVRKRSSAGEDGAVSHWSGLTFVNMTPGLGQYFGAETGVLLVHRADEDLPLMDGDVILEIGRQAPADAAQAVKLLQGYEPGEPVALRIWRHGRAFLVEFDFDTTTLLNVEIAQDMR